jgi:DNA-binding NarL/FixJ family response regulator
MSGYELAAQIGLLRPSMKVLFTSGYTELALLNGHVSHGHNGPLLSKPYRKQELARAVRRQFDGQCA